MDYRVLALPLLVSTSLLFTGCGGGGGSDSIINSDGGGGGGDPALIGLWDVTENGDIQYQEFTADGFVINWDYDDDVEGDGGNCYIRRSFGYEHVGGNEYEGFGGITTLSVSGNQLTIIDSTFTDVFPRLEGLSTTDFNLCS